jgi:ferritin-like metal-binding protein YciE
MKPVTTLEELFVHNLKDVYNAEKQLLKALPKMAKGATSKKLKAAFESHLKETEGQVQRLEKVFQALDIPARGIKCAAMEGLIEEGGEVLEGEFAPSVKDAALIAAANKVEHYEIASYGTLVSFARLLGHGPVEKLLNATLAEEKKADLKLTTLAESEINVLAEVAE